MPPAKARRLTLTLVLTVCALATSPARVSAGTGPPFRLLRYDEDYSYLSQKSPALRSPWEELKYLPLDAGTAAPYASLGGEVRFQYIEKWDDQFGRIPGSEASLQERYLFHATLTWPKYFRVFGQLISAWEHGRKPGPLPTDVDHLDAQQLFGELAFDPDAPRLDYVRVGRQEILLGGHELLKVREGPNVRLAFDGARAHFTREQFDADVFATNVVQPKPGVFDDSWTDDSVRFAGANIGWQPPATGSNRLRADAFVFDYFNRFVRYEQTAGPENRQTYGLRASGRDGPWEFDYEGSLQGGTVGTYDIRAWGVALFNSYHWDPIPTQPEITLGVSSVTGDRNRSDHEVNTFNCLFARGDYFGDTSLLTGSNTLDASMLAECSPCGFLHVSLQWDRLWRSEITDGLYAPPLIYIRSGTVSASRDIGNQLTVAATYRFNRFVTVQLIAADFIAGDFIKAGSPGKGTQGLTFRTQFKF